MRPISRYLGVSASIWILASSDGSGLGASTPGAVLQEGASIPHQESLGSTVPCAVPLRWTLAHVDARFGLGRTDAEAALRDAFRVWEGDVGETLFIFDGDGHPITFEFDQRQASAQRRHAAQAEAATVAEELGARAAQVEAGILRQRSENANLIEAAAAHRARTQRLNDEVAAWNQRRAVPDSVRSRLIGAQRALVVERRELDRWQETITRANDSLSAESQRLNREIDDYNRSQAAAANATISQSQAGEYDEVVSLRGGRVESVDRRIRVYRYDSARDLVVVLAHELGHALGLGHTDAPGAIMNEVSVSNPSASFPELHIRDVEMLVATCPGIGP